jgi:hypothetical protein
MVAVSVFPFGSVTVRDTPRSGTKSAYTELPGPFTGSSTGSRTAYL